MDVAVLLGWLAIGVGATLFLASLWMTLRANDGTRVPYTRNAEVVPRHSVPMRAIGAGLIVISAALLSPTAGYGTVLAPAILAVVALAAIMRHNRGAGRTAA